MVNPLLITLLALVLAYSLSELFKHLFKLPRVIGYLIAGILLGIPTIKNSILTPEITSAFSFISNIGIILLFFFVGLEISFKEFRRNFRESSLIAIFNTLLPLLIGFLVSKFMFNLNNITSIIIGISLSVSSQSISLDILEEAKLLKSRIANIILEAGTVDDVFELLLISIILIVFQATSIGQISIQKLFYDIMLFVLVVILFRISLIPFALKIFEKEKSHASLFMGALIIVLSMAYISELLGISSLIGALIAGILVRETLLRGELRKPWRKNEISNSIYTISFGFLIPIFFVNVGLNTDIYSLSTDMFFVLVLILISILGTILGTIIGVLLSKGSFTEGLIVGWGVVPKGDTELVIATLALTSGLISLHIYTVIITVALVSTLIAPIIFRVLINRQVYIDNNIYKGGKI